MKKAIGELILLALVNIVWTFGIVNFFYGELPRILFLVVVSFIGFFVWIGATHLANVLLHQKSDFRSSIKESLIRTAIGYTVIIIGGLIIWALFKAGYLGIFI